MKILHTADWHIGQSFFDYDRKHEHQAFLTWLLEQLKNKNIDVLLIAGDVFDSPNPSADSQRMLYQFLYRTTNENPNLQIVITAGNHDSAARLEAPIPLLEEMNVTVRGIVKRTSDGEIDYNRLIVPLHGGGVCLAVPYLRQGDYPSAPTYDEGVRKLYDTLLAQVPEGTSPIIAMGHLYAQGGNLSQEDRSERILVGGLDAVSLGDFSEKFTYTALGHLHRYQQVSHPSVRYAGTPLPMSFAEINYTPGIVLVTIEDEITVEHLPFDAPVKLISIPARPASLEEVLQEIEKLPEGEVTDFSPFLEIKILLDSPQPSLRYTIENALKNKSVRLTGIKLTEPEQERSDRKISFGEFKQLSPLEIACEIYRKQYGGNEMPDTLQELFTEVINEYEERRTL